MNVVGNHYDKYGTRNPIARWLVRGFLDEIGALYLRTQARSVLEVGCGEGELAERLFRQRPPSDRFEVSDVDLTKLSPTLPADISRREASIYELPYADSSFDLVICCEVLEHLDEPARGLQEVSRVARNYVLLSTPWEPVWRAMNLARGRYLGALGNTPGHIQHFSRRDLRRLAGRTLEIIEERRPLPWTILLGAPR